MPKFLTSCAFKRPPEFMVPGVKFPNVIQINRSQTMSISARCSILPWVLLSWHGSTSTSLVTPLSMKIFPGRDHYRQGFGIWTAAARLSIFTTNPKVPCRNYRLRATEVLWPTYPGGVGFLVGDFNICDPADGRLNSRSPTFSNGDAQPRRRPPPPPPYSLLK